MILERNPVTEHLLESRMVKCALAIAKRKKQARETLQKKRLRELVVVQADPICDKDLTSVNNFSPAEDQLRIGRTIGMREGCADAGQWSSRQKEKPPNPPDPQEDHISRLALGNCDHASSNVEHSLATNNQNNSQKVSTSVQVQALLQSSVSKLSSQPYTCPDWREDHKLTGEKLPWEPPKQMTNGEVRTPLTNLIYLKKFNLE